MLGDIGIIPVVKIESSSDSMNLAEAFMEGNLPVAEITFRTEGPSRLIREGNFEEITILTRDAVAKVLGFGMDRTNKKIILDCVSTNRSLAFLKRMNINVEYNKDNREISLARDVDGIQVILKDNL